LKNFRNNKERKNGLSVEVRNGDFNGALRKFKRKVQESGIIQDVKEKQYYEKPTAKRKRKKAAAKARWQKKVQRMQDNGLLPTYKKGN